MKIKIGDGHTHGNLDYIGWNPITLLRDPDQSSSFYKVSGEHMGPLLRTVLNMSSLALHLVVVFFVDFLSTTTLGLMSLNPMLNKN